jgi:hypothetical protein
VCGVVIFRHPGLAPVVLIAAGKRALAAARATVVLPVETDVLSLCHDAVQEAVIAVLRGMHWIEPPETSPLPLAAVFAAVHDV